jgi:hypothetical protein
MPTRGDIVIANATPEWSKLAIGAANKILKSDGNDPSWTDAPTIQDVDGDGKSELVVFRPSDGNWYTKTVAGVSTDLGIWGGAAWGDIPLLGDFYGTGHMDIAVYRASNGVLYVRKWDGSASTMITLAASGDMILGSLGNYWQQFGMDVAYLIGKVGIGTTTPGAELSINGGLHVGGDSDPGDNNLEVDGTLLVTGLTKTAGGVHIGGTSDPGADNLEVDGTLLVTGLTKTAGGVHVGGTSDPGTDNLMVDGTIIGMTDLYRIGFTDYSASTTLIGWSGTPSPFILRYKLVGRFCQVWINISGTSNSATTSLTLPYAAKTLTSISQRQGIGTMDNSVWTYGIIAPASGGSTFTAYLNHGLTTWTNSGTKTIIGSFWYETDA